MTIDHAKLSEILGSSEYVPVRDTTNHARLSFDTSGWVIEIESGVWLLSADYEPSRTLVLKNATRWPTERAAKRALSRVRKNCSRKFASAEINFVEDVR